MGAISKALSFLVFSLSFRRSVLHPIKIMGTSRQKWWTSGYHCRRRGKHCSKQNFFFYVNTCSGLPQCCNGALSLSLGPEWTVPLLCLYLNRARHIPLSWHDREGSRNTVCFQWWSICIIIYTPGQSLSAHSYQQTTLKQTFISKAFHSQLISPLSWHFRMMLDWSHRSRW